MSAPAEHSGLSSTAPRRSPVPLPQKARTSTQTKSTETVLPTQVAMSPAKNAETDSIQTPRTPAPRALAQQSSRFSSLLQRIPKPSQRSPSKLIQLTDKVTQSSQQALGQFEFFGS